MKTHQHTLLRLGIAAVVALALTACTDEPTSPVPSVLTQRVQQVFGDGMPLVPIDVPAMHVDVPATRRPWDDDDAELARAVADADGLVLIGFKEPGNSRLVDNGGARGAVTRGTIVAATAVVRAHSDEILYEYRSWGGVAARIDPSDAPFLNGHPLIDFVEPDAPGNHAGGGCCFSIQRRGSGEKQLGTVALAT